MTHNVFSGTLNPTQSINQFLMLTLNCAHDNVAGLISTVTPSRLN